MKNNTTIWMVFVFVVWELLSGCGSETDSGMQNALENGHVTGDINDVDGFNPPQGSLTINDGVVATNQTDVTLKLVASDAVGVTAYYVSSQSANPTTSDSNWNSITSVSSFSKQVSETISAVEKSHSLYAWFRDAAGGTSTQASASIIYDSTAPTVSSVSINSGDSTTTNTVVSLTISASDSLSGITAYYASETSTAPSATATGWIDVTATNSLSTTVSFTLSSPGAEGSFSKTVYLWFKDTAGNVSAFASDGITLIVADTTAPTNPGISINSGASSTTSSSITLSLSASDNVGVSGYYLSASSSTPSATAIGWSTITATTAYSADVSYTLSSLGTTTIYIWFKDGTGNVSANDSASILFVDSTKPENATISINSGSASITSTTVSLALAATDSNSGVTAYLVSESSSIPNSSNSGWISVTSSTSYSATVSFTLATVNSLGTHTKTVYAWFKDSTGNISDTASDSINLVVTDITAPSSTSISIDSGASSTISNSVTITLSAADTIGVTGYYLSESSSTPSSSASGWTSITSSTSYSANVSYTFSGSGTITIYVWFKDTSGNVSSSTSDSISYAPLANIYCGLTNSSTGGTSALSATKLTSGSTRTTTLSSSSYNYYFFFGATSSSTYTIAWSGNAYRYFVYKGVGNEFDSSYTDDDSTTISNYSGDVIIKFDPYYSGETVSFSISGGTIVDYHADKNSYCQSALSLSTNALTATSISTGRVYQATLSSASNNYYAKFSASSSSTYTIAWSGNAHSYYIYKGVGNEFDSSYTDDDITTISNYSGDVIIKFDPYYSGEIVGFMVHEE